MLLHTENSHYFVRHCTSGASQFNPPPFHLIEENLCNCPHSPSPNIYFQAEILIGRKAK